MTLILIELKKNKSGKSKMKSGGLTTAKFTAA